MTFSQLIVPDEQGNRLSTLHRHPETDDHASPWDYRDELRRLIDEAIEHKHTSAYRICKAIGMDASTLTNVLKKRRHFSPMQMQPLLDYFGCRLALVPARKRTQIPQRSNARAAARKV